MKFFVDTADVAEIRDLVQSGLLDGVTTNPSLIAKSGRDFKEVVARIAARVLRFLSRCCTFWRADRSRAVMFPQLMAVSVSA